MSKTIHVPQGRSARLTKASLEYGIESLYTDGFSSCSIIAVIGQEKIALIHADLLTHASDIKEEISSINAPNDIIMVYRPGYEHFLTNRLSAEFKEAFPESRISLKEIDEKHDGILVSFSKDTSTTFHPQIKAFLRKEKPDELLRHADEQKFLAVQKIEQIIGLRAKSITQKAISKQVNIFDGRAWEPLNSREFIVDKSHPATKEELKFFEAWDGFTIIASKLGGIAKSLEDVTSTTQSLAELITPIAFYLEGYLNDFDAPKLLKRNLLQLIDKKDFNSIFRIEKPVSAEDNAIVESLDKELAKNKPDFDVIKTIISTYKQKAVDNSFKKQLCDEFDNFYRHFEDRMVYVAAQQNREQATNKAIKLSEEGKKQYLANQFPAALNLFLDALKHTTYSETKDSKNLVVSYFNVGKALLMSQRYSEAVFFLNTALLLRENYVQSTAKDIEKIKLAIAECENKQEKPESKVPALGAN